MGDKLSIKSEVEITPALMAKLFWNMSDEQQCEFFAELHDITEKESTYGLGEMQWCAMSTHIDKNIKAKKQACSMMVWIFNKATDYLSKSPDTHDFY